MSVHVERLRETVKWLRHARRDPAGSRRVVAWIGAAADHMEALEKAMTDAIPWIGYQASVSDISDRCEKLVNYAENDDA